MGRTNRFASLVICLMMALTSTAAAQAQEDHLLTYIGTSGPKAEGIFVSRFDPATGSLSEPRLVSRASGASFLAIHPTRKFVYAVGQADDDQGGKVGAVIAYSIDFKTGRLEQLNHQPSGGKGPCFVGLDKNGANAFVANYGDGVVAVIPIARDGRLGAPSARVQHEGKGPNEKRQA